MKLGTNFLNLVLFLFFGFTFSIPAYGIEVRNLLYEVHDSWLQRSPGENPGFTGLIQNVNKFNNPVEFVE
jgi:hypothetical protein